MEKALIIIFGLIWLFGTAAFGADIKGVHLLEYNGQRYAVTELFESKREKISRWNMLRFKRGTKYYAFKILDSDYPVRIPESAYREHKKELEDVPDMRPYDQRHPVLQRMDDYGPVISAGFSLAGLFFR